MATMKEVELMSAKEIEAFLDKNTEKMTLLVSKAAEIKAQLVIYYHVKSLRTSIPSEKIKWDLEIASN